jgi:hypothetical protein
MTGYDFIECAKRLGLVLMGRVEPSVAQVRSVAAEVVYTNRQPPTPRSYIPSRANGRGR